MSFQQIIIVGNLGRDPETRYLPSGQAVTNMSVAASRAYVNGAGQKVEDTVWFRCAVWGKQAEACAQYLKKGAKVLVEGRMLEARAFQKQDGTWGSSLEVNAQNVRFLSSNGGNGNSGSNESEAPAGEESGDIPF